MHLLLRNFKQHDVRRLPIRNPFLLGIVLLSFTASAVGCKPEETSQRPVATQPKAEKKPVKKKRPSFPIPVESDSRKTAEQERQEIAEDLFATEELVAPAQVDSKDETKLAEAGIRKISGRHLTLYTDLPITKEIDVLPKVFDLAVPQWAQYFEVDPQRLTDWSLTGYLIQNRQKFKDHGLLPREIPRFDHGYQLGKELWLHEQPSDYYRRHLLLHEGTHGFMTWFLGGTGPPWYMEGMAELLATHRWQDGKLQLRYMPRDKKETPFWGRIKIIKDRVNAGSPLLLSQILNFGPITTAEVDGYAWCWAASVFLDSHPEYQQKFREMKEFVRLRDEKFSQQLQRRLVDKWTNLVIEWQLFIGSIEYGHEIDRDAVQFSDKKPEPAKKSQVTIAADRGWQSTGILLKAGKSYTLTAQGRYQVAKEPKIWWCEPGGVTIRYHRGRPLGMLLAMIIDKPMTGGGEISISRPTEVGLSQILTPQKSGTLYLRINDSPASLSNNSGTLSIIITEE